MSLSTFRLATHVNAALAGYDVKIGMLPEFAGETEWLFLVPGPNGLKLRLVPDDWVATMRLRGDRLAWFGYGPKPEVRGEGMWTCGDGGVCFYRLTGRKTEGDGRFQATLTGHARRGSSPLESVEDATRRLQEALAPMIALAAGRPEFERRLTESKSILMGQIDPSSTALSAFPPGLYPPISIRLYAAAARGDVFGNGGMGWWRDAVPLDEAAEWATQMYQAARFEAFVAASRFDLNFE